MKIFLSYRRSDSRHIAGRLAERLNDSPGVRKVFLDVDGIDPGSNFETKIEQALSECDVCLIIIGDDWIGASKDSGSARILNEADFVRREAAAALASGKKVIPVLVDGAPMPAADALPPDVRSVVTIDAVFVRHASFNQDMELVDDAVFSRQARTPISRFFLRRPFFTLFLKVVFGVIVSGALLIGLSTVHREVTDGRALEETLGSEGLVWLIILVSLTLGAVVPAWLSLRR